jgi:hypothetical protein
MDEKQGGLSEKGMEKIVRAILLSMLGLLIVVMLSLRACEEVIKNEQQETTEQTE